MGEINACNRHLLGGGCFHDDAIIEAFTQWCLLVDYDTKDEKIFTAFCMGAKLALSNNGWCNCHQQ